MKKLLILILFAAQIAVAQNEPVPTDDNVIYNTAGLEVKPEFPGGLTAFYKYVETNFVVPNEPGLKGKIFVMFVVEKDGSLSDIKILRDIGFGTGKEAIRVMKLSPKWNPGKQNGKAVRTLYSLPISIPGIPQPTKDIQEIKDK